MLRGCWRERSPMRVPRGERGRKEEGRKKKGERKTRKPVTELI
jgi:hypothetical protein